MSEPALFLGAGAAEISQETLYVYERPSHNDHHSHNDKDALDDHVCKNPHQRNGNASKSKEMYNIKNCTILLIFVSLSFRVYQLSESSKIVLVSGRPGTFRAEQISDWTALNI